MTFIEYILSRNLVEVNAKKLKIPPPYFKDFCQDIYEIVLNKGDSLNHLSPPEMEKYLYQTIRYHSYCKHIYNYINYDRRNLPINDLEL